MKILLITSRAASGIVKEIVEELKKHYEKISIDVHVVDYPTVASSFTVEILRKQVPVDLARNYDVIIVPGLTRGDLSEWSRVIGVPIYKGTIHAVDIPLVIEALANNVELSGKVPADYILYERIRAMLRNILLKERAKNTVVINYNGIEIADRSPPIRLVAEIPPRVSVDEAVEMAKRFQEEGADIIVVGSDGKNIGGTIDKIVKISKTINKPLGIDTNNPKEIIKALDKGVSIVFSLNQELILKLEDYSRKAIFTLIPDRGYENPWNISERVNSVLKNIDIALKRGYDKIIVDPVLGPLPLGFTPSIIALYEIKKRKPKIPIVFSASNVIDSIEADTHGILAMLAGMAFEMGASILHVVEDAPYEYGSVAEARVALAMAEIAYARKTQERDIGINMLVLKDNRIIRQEPIKAKQVVSVVERIEPSLDRAGYFRIQVSKKRDAIEVGFYKYGRDDEAEIKIVGRHALSIGRRILEEVKVSDQHILYLGYELSKAEIALKLHKNYIQDEELFETVNDKLKLVDKIVRQGENPTTTDN